MTMLQSRNPTMGVFEKPQTWDDLDQAERKLKTMSINGVVFATSVLLAICGASAVATWNMFVDMFASTSAGAGSGNGLLWLGGSMIGGLVLCLVISFKPVTAPVLSPIYAAIQGVFVSAFSAIIAYRYLGAADNPEALDLIAQALFLTLGVLGGMLIAYRTGLIRIGGTFAKIMMGALIGVVLYSVVVMIGNGLLGAGIPNLFDSASPLGIGFSVLLVALASLFLVLDFQMIEAGVKNQAPKYMNWYGGFSLLVTLVWLYIEILRLLAKLRSSD
ncbi:MAG: Bax inhibitor-1/YccA family protein [Phycisphaerales bacterium JB040]